MIKKCFLITILAVLISPFLISVNDAGETLKASDSRKDTIKMVSQYNRPLVKDSLKNEASSKDTTMILSNHVADDSVYYDRALSFLDSIKNHYGIRNPRAEFIINRFIRDNNRRILILDQVYNGIKVRYGYFSINLTKSDSLSINDIAGFYESGIRSINTNPSLSEEQAKQIALDDSRAYHTTTENVKSIELIIGKFNDVLRLAWAVNVCKLDSVIFNSDYYIDAQTGEILDIKTRIRD